MKLQQIVQEVPIVPFISAQGKRLARKTGATVDWRHTRIDETEGAVASDPFRWAADAIMRRTLHDRLDQQLDEDAEPDSSFRRRFLDVLNGIVKKKPGKQLRASDGRSVCFDAGKCTECQIAVGQAPGRSYAHDIGALSIGAYNAMTRGQRRLVG